MNLLIIDDFALRPLDETATTDFYELTVARHHSACHELVIEGDSYRKRQRPSRHPA